MTTALETTMSERLLGLLGVEPLILLSVFALIAYAIYKLFFRGLNQDRHDNLRNLFNNLWMSHLGFLITWGLQDLVHRDIIPLERFYTYFGIAAVLFGAVTFVRTVKIFVFEYLFYKSMNVGVPLLLVDLVTMVVSIFIVAWLSTSVFGVRWAPLLATSAFVSVVLGLALQETLGNLFAGVALQFDKPYEIGDWIEMASTSNNAVFVGEVHEITWRATTLYGLFNEVIILPNRLIAQSEVSNFSARRKPIYRGFSIYVDSDSNDEKVKEIFVKVLKESKGVIQHLEHFITLRELTERGSHWRVVYPITHFRQQFQIIDDILMRTQKEFKSAGVAIASLRVDSKQKFPVSDTLKAEMK